jgi:hypothetical protein
MDRPDQDAVRQDLVAFFGRRGEVFLRTYDRMRARSGRRRLAARSWCWPGFLLSFAWFFYRKMYGLGAVLLFVPLGLAYLGVGVSTLAFSIVMAGQGKPLYVRMAAGRIARADELGLAGSERADYLGRAGGVSPAGGVLGGVVLAGLVSLVAVGVAMAFHGG